MLERVSCVGRGREWAERARREGARGEAGPAQGKGEGRELGRAGPAWGGKGAGPGGERVGRPTGFGVVLGFFFPISISSPFSISNSHKI